MTVSELIDLGIFKTVSEGGNPGRNITTPYCCDLLSIAMGRMPAGAAWVTVMSNVNTLAVASLTDAALIILAEGSEMAEETVSKAKEKGITVLASNLPVFEAALKVYKALHA
jgi:hypothetical protein